MSNQTEPGTAVAVAPAGPPPAVPDVLSDDEMRRMFRIAEALHLSGAFKTKKAEAAFSKMVVGHYLGLSPAQAMTGVHIVEGGVQMHYSTLGHFVRAREGYDYRAGWLKEEATLDVGTRDEETGEVRETVPRVVAVYHDEEEATDLRTIVGAFVEFAADGKRRGISRFTNQDAVDAGLIKANLDPRAAWKTSRRNMLLARAMSNGVKWFVPEILGGLPVYTPGETPTQPSLTEGTGTESDEGQGIDLGPKIEKIIERATALGHRGLSNRATVELAVGNRAPSVLNDWVGRASAELDRFERERAAQADEATGEVQGDAPSVPEVEVEAPPEEVTAEPVPEESAPEDPRERLQEHLDAEGREER